MTVPNGSFAVAALIILALPGLVNAGIRRWARGEDASDRNLGLSFARGLVFAVALTSGYFSVAGPYVFAGVSTGQKADTLTVVDPRQVGLTVIVFYLLLPAALSLILNLKHIAWISIERAPWIRYPRSRAGYTETPSAWEFAALRLDSCWVRIRRADGKWIGGWFTKGSFANSYPEEQAIYIGEQWVVDSDGNFVAPVPSTGVYVKMVDTDVVQWTRGDVPPPIEGIDLG